MAKSIFKNALFKGILSFCNIAVPILVIPYVYRVFDPQIIGNIEYGNSLYTYFYIFGSLGIYGYGLREISKVRNNTEQVKTIYLNLFWIGVAANLLAILSYLTFVFVGFEKGVLQNILLLYSISLFANAFYTEWINEAYEEYIFITLKTLAIRSISVILIFLLIKAKTDYYIYILITVTVLFANNIVSFKYALRFTHLEFSFKEIQWRKYLPPLFYIFILNNSAVLYTTLDKTVLGTFTNVKSVAYYGIGQKIMEFVRGLLMAGVYVSLPRLSFYLRNDYDRYIAGLQKITKLIAFIVIPSSVGLILISREILLLFGGGQYLPAMLPAQVFFFRIIILTLEDLLAQQVLFLHGKEKVILKINIGFGILNLLLKYLLIGIMTPLVAILTTAFCEVLIIASERYYIKHYLKITVQLFTRTNGIYLIGALLFIPMVSIIRIYFHSSLLILLVSVICCSILYLITLLVARDSFVLQQLSRLKRVNLKSVA